MMSPSNTINSTQCGVPFNIPPSGFMYPVLQLFGTMHIYLPVNHPPMNGSDYAFSGMFLLSNNTGTLFHYMPFDTSQTFKEMILWVSNGSINLLRNLFSVPEQTTIGTFSVDKWNHVSFGVHNSAGKIKMHLDNQKLTDMQGSTLVDLVLPGVLRIGAAHDHRKPSMVGSVCCVGFHSSHSPKMDDTTKLCKAPNWSTSMYYLNIIYPLF